MNALDDKAQSHIRAIAFYLPQYHPVAENDEWWGKGFTEWRNVTQAKPLFPGHDQPNLPADLGFYDLRLPEVREAQAEMARQHGIHGFCYYHYWFNGRRILERPFNEVLESGQPELPFCLCWANENWTRVWDGGEKNVLLEQRYSPEDDQAHIESLIPAFRDPRYIRVDGKPLFLVYRTELLPDPAATAKRWRGAAAAAGLPGLYLVRVEGFQRDINPASIGFDAAVEFAPDTTSGSAGYMQEPLVYAMSRLGLMPEVFAGRRVFTYQSVARSMAARGAVAYKRFRCVAPMWDNTARRGLRGTIYTGSTPGLYEHWLRQSLRQTRQERQGDERLIFINAWNEWAEGCHLEPGLRWGHQYLQATRSALTASNDASEPALHPAAPPASGDEPPAPVSPRLLRTYWQLRESAVKWVGVGRQMRHRIASRLMPK